MTSIDACIPEWTREVSTFSNGELLKTTEEYVFNFYFLRSELRKRIYLAWIKILSAELSKRGLKYAA